MYSGLYSYPVEVQVYCPSCSSHTFIHIASTETIWEAFKLNTLVTLNNAASLEQPVFFRKVFFLQISVHSFFNLSLSLSLLRNSSLKGNILSPRFFFIVRKLVLSI